MVAISNCDSRGVIDGEAVIYDEATGAIAGTLVNGATDSFAARIAGITAGIVARDWAGNGDYTVDGSVKGGEDAILFRAGLTMYDIVIERSGTTGTPGQDLIIRLVTKVAVPVSTLYPNGLRTDLTGDRLVIRDWFESTRRIEWLRFANGDDIRIGDVSSYLIGTGGNDVIVGTKGADFLGACPGQAHRARSGGGECATANIIVLITRTPALCAANDNIHSTLWGEAA
jgi:Ca2+-binding RTX toxin-like protein